MRISKTAKLETRQRILEAAIGLFQRDGWDNTTTRAIALAAGIATGTLFNYFPTKEAIAATLIGEAFERSAEKLGAGPWDGNSLEADLFTLVWSGLASLREFRTFLGPACEAIFSPLARGSSSHAGDAIRVVHLETVQHITAAHGSAEPLSVLSAQLYWSLYLGTVAFWATDDSPNQEDSLALLDRSLGLFVKTLDYGKETHGRQRITGRPAGR